MADEFRGRLPDAIERKLHQRLEELTDVLADAIPPHERISWERIEAAYLALPATTVDVIMQFLASRPVTVIHYVGNVDAPLCKALTSADRYKLTVMDMLNKHETGRGYLIDTDLNLSYFGRPPWLKWVAFYEEGAPHLADCWIRDCKWDRPEQLDEILNGRRRGHRTPYLVLLSDAIEHGRHSYYQWEELGGVYFGELRKEHESTMPDDERSMYEESDRRLRGERKKAEENAAEWQPVGDTMTSRSPDDIERACIERASTLVKHEAERALGELVALGIPFDNEFAGFGLSSIEWHKDRLRRIVQAVVLPIALIFLVLVFVPFLYAGHVLMIELDKRKLRKEIQRLEAQSGHFPLPGCSTLSQLWVSCEFIPDRGRPRFENFGLLNIAELKLRILSDWLDIMYGDGTSQALDLPGRIAKMARQSGEANQGYYEGKPGAPHLYFGPPIDDLIRTLSQERPPYR